MRIGVVVLAAGLSRRFGGNKLLAEIGDRPMVEYAFALLDALEKGTVARKAAVIREVQVAALARAHGMQVIVNNEPELGQAHSIVLSVQAMRDMDAILFMTGDQPRLTFASIVRLLHAYEVSGKGLACMRDDTHMGNPAVFSSRYFDTLLSLQGDRGAKRILLEHESDLIVVPCEESGELTDIDVPQALARI